MSETTRTFQGAIEMSKRWSQIRFSESVALSLIAQWHAVRQSPSDYPKLTELWNTFFEMQSNIQERFEHTDWGKIKGEVLVLLAISSIEIRKGIRHFLPVHFAFNDKKKEDLWAWYLLNRGISSMPDDPYCFLYPSATLFMGGPYAAREIECRARKHPLGFAAGLIGFLSKSDENLLEASELELAALKQLARSARSKIPDPMRPRSVFWEGKTSRDVGYNKLGPLEAQAAETVLKDFCRGTAEEIVARSLDGLLNVAPEAIAMDVIDKYTERQPTFERGGVVLKSSAEDMEEIRVTFEDYQGDPAIMEDNSHKKHIEKMYYWLDMFVAEKPRDGKILRDYLDGIKLKDQARAGKKTVTTRAVKKRRQKARETFENWLRRRGIIPDRHL